MRKIHKPKENNKMYKSYKNNENVLSTEPQEIVDEWAEYYKELFSEEIVYKQCKNFYRKVENSVKRTKLKVLKDCSIDKTFVYYRI